VTVILLNFGHCDCKMVDFDEGHKCNVCHCNLGTTVSVGQIWWVYSELLCKSGETVCFGQTWWVYPTVSFCVNLVYLPYSQKL